MNYNLSLAEAISASGGLQVQYASPKDIYVIRNTSDAKVDIYQLDAKNAMSLALADRFELNPRDIVYVDASGIATWNRLISLITPTMGLIRQGIDMGYYVQQMHNEGWR